MHSFVCAGSIWVGKLCLQIQEEPSKGLGHALVRKTMEDIPSPDGDWSFMTSGVPFVSDSL